MNDTFKLIFDNIEIIEDNEDEINFIFLGFNIKLELHSRRFSINDKYYNLGKSIEDTYLYVYNECIKMLMEESYLIENYFLGFIDDGVLLPPEALVVKNDTVIKLTFKEGNIVTVLDGNDDIDNNQEDSMELEHTNNTFLINYFSNSGYILNYSEKDNYYKIETLDQRVFTINEVDDFLEIRKE